MPHLIFGIDPGNTIGIAAVDFSGRKISSLSIQNGGISSAVSAIEKIGTPSIIACDVYPVPELVLRIASSFNVRIFSPQKEVREEQKRQIAASLGGSIANNHERDAFSAAILAYRAYQNRLRQIDMLEDFSQPEKARLAHFVLNGYSLRGAIIATSAKDEKQQPEQTPQQQMPKKPESKEEMRSEITKLTALVSSLSHANSQLTLALEAIRFEKDALLHKMRLLENGVYERMRHDKEISELRFKAKRLESELEWMRGKRQHAEKGPQPNEQKTGEAQKHAPKQGGEKTGEMRKNSAKSDSQIIQGRSPKQNSAAPSSASSGKVNLKEVGESEVERMLREYRGKRI